MPELLNKRFTPYDRFLIPALVALAGFLVGYIHHHWFYPLDFHSDAAALQVLAQAMVDEGSLLPRDFIYGNQLIIFRSSPFIALALLAGKSGFDAYILGSALSIAFWTVVLYVVLAAYLANRPKAALIALLFVVPMSVWEYDYVLGQQSHLSNAVMSACAVLMACHYAARGKAAGLAVAAGLIFLMSCEAPMRALLVLVPLALGATMYFERRPLVRLLATLALACVAGIVVNKLLLKSHPVGVNLFATMVFHSTTEIIETMHRLALEMLGAISSANVFAASRMKIAGLVLYGATVGYLLTVCGFALWRAAALYKRIRARSMGHMSGTPADAALAAWDFPAAVALIGVVVGTLIVAMFNPDTARHIIWAGMLLRLSLLMAVCHLVLRCRSRRALALAGLALAVALSSFWSATLYRFRGQTAQPIQVHNFPAFHENIRKYSVELGINRVLGGDFWRMHTLNATVPNIKAGTLVVGELGLIPDTVLSRRSLFDPGQVLYYLKTDKVDALIREKLSGGVGRQLVAAGDESLWVGPAVWGQPVGVFEWQGCKLSTMIGQPTAACHVEKKNPADAGFLTFGPYVKLTAGKYAFELEYASPAAASKQVAAWDVVSTTKVLTTLGAGTIDGSAGKVENIKGEFIVSGNDGGPIEIRTTAYPGAALRVQKLRIVRVVD